MKNRRKRASKPTVDKDLGRKACSEPENRATASHTPASDLSKRPRDGRGSAGGRPELIEAARVRRVERTEYLEQIRREFVEELGFEPRGAKRALLETVVSATFEIFLMTSRAARSFVSGESLNQLSKTRGELRRSLRSLGLVRDFPEEHDENAPPDVADEEATRRWAAKYVQGVAQ